MQRQNHVEFLTTLHHVATTAATIFGTLAQRHDDPRSTTARPAAESSPPPAPEDEPVTTEAQASPDRCVLCGATSDGHMVTVTHARICESCIQASARELLLKHERDTSRALAHRVCQRLGTLADLAGEAIERDGLQTLPILDDLLSSLATQFSERRGPFASHRPAGLEPGAIEAILRTFSEVDFEDQLKNQ